MKIHGDLEKLDRQTKLIILIGESGAGKSTLAKALNMPDNWFVSSQLMIEEIKKRGLSVNHDTIHQIAKERYEKDVFWQIPHMLEVLNQTGLLLLDGPRRTEEVDKILSLCPESFIIRISSSSRLRQERLCDRDGADKEEFKRVITDEHMETGLWDRLLSMADIIVENSGSIKDIDDLARKILARIKS